MVISRIIVVRLQDSLRTTSTTTTTTVTNKLQHRLFAVCCSCCLPINQFLYVFAVVLSFTQIMMGPAILVRAGRNDAGGRGGGAGGGAGGKFSSPFCFAAHASFSTSCPGL